MRGFFTIRLHCKRNSNSKAMLDFSLQKKKRKRLQKSKDKKKIGNVKADVRRDTSPDTCHWQKANPLAYYDNCRTTESNMKLRGHSLRAVAMKQLIYLFLIKWFVSYKLFNLHKALLSDSYLKSYYFAYTCNRNIPCSWIEESCPQRMLGHCWEANPFLVFLSALTRYYTSWNF